MGLFDTVNCKYDLPMPSDPKGYIGSENFQTKDLECLMEYYEIREDGTLWMEKRIGHWTEGNKKSSNFFEAFPRFITEKIEWEKINATQTINLYDYSINDNLDYDFFISYEVAFVEGKIFKTKISEFNKVLNFERKKRDEELVKEIIERKKFYETKMYKYVFGPYNTFITGLFRGLRRIFSSVDLYRLELKLKITHKKIRGIQKFRRNRISS